MSGAVGHILAAVSSTGVEQTNRVRPRLELDFELYDRYTHYKILRFFLDG